MNKTETKNCQSCSQEFRIEPEDFDFYEKVKIPIPTWCPDCRLQRRMLFRNERIMYKRRCNAPGHNEDMISIFSPDKPDVVYDQKIWWSDTWDPLEYGQEIDFSKPFFEQIKELWKQVPDIALFNINAVNSEYCSITEGNKNCYLVIGGDFNENVLYAAFVFRSREVVDAYWVSDSDLNYETTDCIKCSRLFYSRYCDECYDSMFLFNCKNCHDCFGCVNLRNQSYQIYNIQYTKKEYFSKIQEIITMGSFTSIENTKSRFQEFMLKYPQKFARLVRSVNSSGDDLEGAKNTKNSFSTFGAAEDCRYVWLSYSNIKDCYDCDHLGLNSERSCECSTLYPGNRVFFSRMIMSSHDILYSYNCHNCSNLFGCIGLRHKQYCILNKQYSEQEYEELVPKIIQQMNDLPYTDKKGRVYKYGEFFPPELSPFAYNETVAQEYFPLTKDQALKQGYSWKDPEKKDYEITIKSKDLPDHIKEVKDDIINQVISCEHQGKCNEQCTTAFRIIPEEFQFYKKMNLPLPRLCPNCRHYQRLKQRNPLKLWSRKCQCAGGESDNKIYQNTVSHFHKNEHCPNEFETTYAPNRKEIVYCEKCYQAEVV